MSRLETSARLEAYRKKVAHERSAETIVISVSSGTCGLARGSDKVVEAFEEAVQGKADRIKIRVTGCHGYCAAEPNVIVYPDEVFYGNLSPDDASKVVEAASKGEIIESLLVEDRGERFAHLAEIPFYKTQKRLVLGNNPLVDPTRIEDYIAVGGYSALPKALAMEPQELVDTVKRSGLRGRGGAGFPTGKKWEIARERRGEDKHLVCNADEGDPGAYMDRSLLEGNPHAVLEGMIIGAYGIGARHGWIYVRHEYPLAVEHVTRAIEQARECGLIGANILGSGFDFDAKVHRGAGAFVCGEETALLISLEGKPGEPRPRPPYPAVKGLWDEPTNINNVETWANVPLIVSDGASAFASIGTGGSKGTKIFSLVGKIANTGLVEVPMGMPLRDVIYAIGGGIPGGRKFKAVQTGGPSGGCIPEKLLDLEVGFDELVEAGSMMGSGGMIVMDEDTCMVDVARYFIAFLTEESCGKCVPCREGLRQMHRILTRITGGKGKEGDLETLQELSETAVEASICGLGKTAPNPFLSTLRYFRDEYEAHVREKRCPAFSCKELIAYTIDPARCQACMICLRKCPATAVDGGKDRIHVIDQGRCTKCGICFEVCPPRFAAVKRISGEPVPSPIPEEERMIVRRSKENE